MVELYRESYENIAGTHFTDRAWSKMTEFFAIESNPSYYVENNKLNSDILDLLEILDPAEENNSHMGLTEQEYKKAWELRIGFDIWDELWSAIKETYDNGMFDTQCLVCRVFEYPRTALRGKVDFLIDKSPSLLAVRNPVRKADMTERLGCEISERAWSTLCASNMVYCHNTQFVSPAKAEKLREIVEIENMVDRLQLPPVKLDYFEGEWFDTFVCCTKRYIPTEFYPIISESWRKVMPNPVDWYASMGCNPEAFNAVNRWFDDYIKEVMQS